jgi:hypothetical protein
MYQQTCQREAQVRAQAQLEQQKRLHYTVMKCCMDVAGQISREEDE